MKLTSEQSLQLAKFEPRWYQYELFDAVENKGYRRIVWCAPRRCGKDISCWLLAIRYALRKTCLVFYVLPTYSQARKTLWDALTTDGVRFLDYIPKSLIQNINQQEMKIRLLNNSLIQLIGGDSYDTALVGTNPSLIIYSEYSRMTEKAWEFSRPILASNLGTAVFNSTPYGRNHFWHLFQVAKELPDWHVIHHKTSDINHIDPNELQHEREQMSPELFAQEYECDFSRGVQGSYHAQYIEKMRHEGRITHVPFESGLLTHTAFDIGVHDQTTIVFFQVAAEGNIIRVIDCYSNNNLGVDHYAHVLQEKPYRYGKHFAPPDIQVREWGGGAITRWQKAYDLGIEFQTLPQQLFMDGLETVWSTFPRIWIDENKCKPLINALENYYREYDEIHQLYKDKPIRNWATHYSDAFRYMCASIPSTKAGMTGEDYSRIRAQALYGTSDALPRFFQRNQRYDRPF